MKTAKNALFFALFWDPPGNFGTFRDFDKKGNFARCFPIKIYRFWGTLAPPWQNRFCASRNGKFLCQKMIKKMGYKKWKNRKKWFFRFFWKSEKLDFGGRTRWKPRLKLCRGLAHKKMVEPPRACARVGRGWRSALHTSTTRLFVLSQTHA